MTQLIAAATPPTDPACHTNILTDWINPGCTTQSVASTVIEHTFLNEYLDDIKAGLTNSVKTMVTFWTSVPDPAVTNADGSYTEPVAFLQSNLAWLVAVIMCFATLAGLAIVAWTQRTEGFMAIVQMLLTYIGYMTLGGIAISVGLLVINALSAKLIEDSTQGTSFADNMLTMFESYQGVGSAIIAGILLLLGAGISLFTCVLMIARGGILLALIGALGLSIAVSAMDFGKALLRHYLGWILAFVFYKLAAAVIYAIGFRMLGANTGATDQGLLQILYGLTLLSLAVLALPAMIRLVVPAVSPVAQGRGAGGVIAGTAAAVSMAAARR